MPASLLAGINVDTSDPNATGATAIAPDEPAQISVGQVFSPQGMNRGPSEVAVQGYDYTARVVRQGDVLHTVINTDGGYHMEVFANRQQDGRYRLNRVVIGSVRYDATGEDGVFRKTLLTSDNGGYLYTQDRTVRLSDEPAATIPLFERAQQATDIGGTALAEASRPGARVADAGPYQAPDYERRATEANMRGYQLFPYQETRNVAFSTNSRTVVQEVHYNVNGADVRVNVKYHFGAPDGRVYFEATGSISGNSRFAGGTFAVSGQADAFTPINNANIWSQNSRFSAGNLSRGALPPELAPLGVIVSTNYQGLYRSRTNLSPMDSVTIGGPLRALGRLVGIGGDRHPQRAPTTGPRPGSPP